MARLEPIVTVKYANGEYEFKLVQALKDRDIKHSQFIRDMETTYNTFYRYAVGSIQRVDLDTLDRWCEYLDCKPTELITYTKNKP